MKYSFILFLTGIFIFSCQKNGNVTLNEDYPIKRVDVRNVKLTDDFWLPIIHRVQEKTIKYALEKCQEEGRFDNFLIAGGQIEGEVRGKMPFDDTDVYKIIEGASNSLISAPNADMEVLLDSIIEIIAIGQEEDGYLTTWRTIDPAKPPANWVKVKEGKRWESLDMSHELYNAGHLYEAAVVHYQATGKRNFLDIAIKNADLIVEVFGEKEGQINAVPGHQIIETGLLNLYKVTGRDAYRDQAKFFLDHRGGNGFGPYAQDHKPVTEQDEAVGHAVRAVYMYAAMTDIIAMEKSKPYQNAVLDLWNNVVDKKMYVTGGIGAVHHGEAFGDNYELPNLSAYNETCAAIGSVYWNSRLFNLFGDVKYNDVLERTLYNAVIPGISLNGQRFFYPNPLESDGVYEFNQGALTRKDWFDCSCCPTNLIRFLPAVPGLIYSTNENTLYINQYISNEAEIQLDNGVFRVSLETQLPWKGKTVFKILEAPSTIAEIRFRIPGWARNQVVPSDLYSYQDSLNYPVVYRTNWDSNEVSLDENEEFLSIERAWSRGEEIALEFPMQVRKVKATEYVKEDSGKVALEYGPLVYAFEEADNPDRMDDLKLEKEYRIHFNSDLLGGVNVLEGETGYKAIPYYSWSNRGLGKMKVWLDQ